MARRPSLRWRRVLFAFVLAVIAGSAPGGPIGEITGPRAASAAPEPPLTPQQRAVEQTAGVWQRVTPLIDLPAVNGIAMNGPALAESTTIIAGTSNGIYRSTNGGTVWSSWSTGLPERSVSQLLYSPGTRWFYALVGGSVYCRGPADRAWRSLSAGLPAPDGDNAASVDGIAVGLDGTLAAVTIVYVASNAEYTVYVRGPSASGWVSLNPQYPFRDLSGLAIGKGEVVVAGKLVAQSGVSDPAIFTHTVTAAGQPGAGGWDKIVYNLGSTERPNWQPPVDHNRVTSLTADAEGQIYAGFAALDVSGRGGVWYTGACGDGRRCWRELTAPADQAGSRNVLDLVVAPPLILLVQSGQAVRSNLSSTYSTVYSLDSTPRAAALSPALVASGPSDGVFLLGMGDGVLRSISDRTPQPANDGLGTVFHTRALTAAGRRTLFAASSSGIYRSTDGGASWTNTRGISGFSNPTIAASTVYDGDGRIYLQTSVANQMFYSVAVARSDSRGTTWLGDVGTNVSLDHVGNLLAVDPASSQIVYSGAPGVIGKTAPNSPFVLQGVLTRSTDAGATWAPSESGLVGRDLLTLAAAPAPGIAPALLAGTDAGLFSFDGAAWHDFNQGASPGKVRLIAYSPGYRGGEGLYALADAGLLRYTPGTTPGWATVPIAQSGGLQLTAVQSLALSPAFAADHTLIAGTAGGAYLSQDGGSSWRRINAGLSDLNVTHLAFSPNYAVDRAIFAGTANDGVFRYVMPPPAPPWLIMLYLAGDDSTEHSLSEPLAALRDRIANLSNPAARIVLLYDGNGVDDTLLAVREAGAPGLRTVDPPPTLAGRELDTGSYATVQSFVRWALETFPGSQHTMLSIVDHGGGWAPDLGTPGQANKTMVDFQAGGWRGMGLDTASDSSLSTRDTARALAGALGETQRLDVVFFDACLMGMLETAYEIRAHADYLIAGQSLLWANLPYEQYLAPPTLDGTTTPEQLAERIVAQYNRLGADSPEGGAAAAPGETTALPPYQPFAIGAIRLAALDDLTSEVDALAELLRTELASKDLGAPLLAAVRRAYADVQKFDYDASLSIDDTDGYVDLRHLARLLGGELAALGRDNTLAPGAAARLAALKALADAVVARLVPQGSDSTDPTSAILAIKRNSAPARSGGPYHDFEDAGGLSIYLPIGEQDCRPTHRPGQAGAAGGAGPCRAGELAEVAGYGTEDQLGYYVNPEQLAMTAEAPGWSELLSRLTEKLGADIPLRNLAQRPFSSPSQMPGTFQAYLPLVADRLDSQARGAHSP